MLRKTAQLFGIILILLGILGFVPGITTNGYLFGIFHVNLVHNLIHLATGVIALFVAMKSESASRSYFQVFGIIYGIVAILGLFYRDRYIFGVVANNIPDVVLHFAITAVALYLGFARRRTITPTTTTQAPMRPV